MVSRYYPFSRFLRKRFGAPVYKIPLDAGFSCPNRDGTIGRGGCAFCYNPSFGPFADRALPIDKQIAVWASRLRRRHRNAVKFLAYLQNYTNTYGPPAQLERIYDAALAHPDVIGLAIGTRPDCVPDPVLDLIESYAATRHVWLEYGLQSIHNRTLVRINRGHTAEQFMDAVCRTRGRGIFVCAHVILGLPGETPADAVATARALTELRLDGVKIHHLQVLRGTPLAAAYQNGGLEVLAPAEYVRWVCDFLEHLGPRITIHRLVGDVLDGDLLVAPRWRLTKSEMLRRIERELERRGTVQGSALTDRPPD
ncbi:MAG: TIGR01212 family radical SAM protein [Candidatus Desulforudis sp.]|nr:TIGR01212 family radical SAM protein [Desulforudis sp.]